jgi:hypothetical protein
MHNTIDPIKRYKGHKITTLAGLAKAAKEKRAVFVPAMSWFRKPQAAAFVMNYQGQLFNRLFQEGMYVYKKYNGVFAEAPWERKGERNA